MTMLQARRTARDIPDTNSAGHANPVADSGQAALAEAARLATTGRPDEAEAAYVRLIATCPASLPALLGLAALRAGRGDGAGAQFLLSRACFLAPDRPELWHALGQALLVTADIAAAETAFAEACRRAPADPRDPGSIDRRLAYARLRCEAAHMAGNAAALRAQAEAILDADPLDAAALFGRAVLLALDGQRAEALDAAEAAAILLPGAAEPAKLFGRLLARTLRAAEAAEALARAVALAPDDADLGNDHAVALVRVYRFAEAAERLAAIVARHGATPARLSNLANATLALGRQEEAAAIARRAVASWPEDIVGHRALLNALAYLPGTSAAALRDAACACAAHIPGATSAPAPCGPAWSDRDLQRPLRIGLLSGTLKIHPVGWLTVAGLEALDPAQFRLVAFAQHTARDPIARRFQSIADWHAIDTMEDAALTGHIRAQAIDVLIDLGGYGDHGRLTACAARAAPVQIKWVGAQSHSTGMAAMDWLLTDRWETPQGSEPHYTERLLRLRDGYVCYSPPEDAPPVTPLPALANAAPPGGGGGGVTFGCFNNLAKINAEVVAAWTAILHALPHARLLLKTQQFADAPTCARVRGWFAERGIDPARILLQPGAPHRAFLAAYADVDIVLDPFPYSGGLTTCEALFMGVPVLALPGETFASRHSLSHLCNVGLDADWVARDPADYVARAVRAAADLPALAALRAALRTRVLASPLCDAPRFGQSLGTALRHAWTTWCAEAPS
jgi:predicted O-linked N-acetylglucosamine transferase (SPINDLY family)